MGYSGQDLVNALKQTRSDLLESVERWRTYGHLLAAAERDYRIANRAEVFALHEEKVPWTTANDVSRGDESRVALL
jgi:hypothetical protein